MREFPLLGGAVSGVVRIGDNDLAPRTRSTVMTFLVLAFLVLAGHRGRGEYGRSGYGPAARPGCGAERSGRLGLGGAAPRGAGGAITSRSGPRRPEFRPNGAGFPLSLTRARLSLLSRGYSSSGVSTWIVGRVVLVVRLVCVPVLGAGTVTTAMLHRRGTTTAMLHRRGCGRAGARAVPVPVVRERPLGRAGLAWPPRGSGWPPPGWCSAARRRSSADDPASPANPSSITAMISSAPGRRTPPGGTPTSRAGLIGVTLAACRVLPLSIDSIYSLGVLSGV